VDDGSTDRTAARLRELASRHRHVLLLVHERNEGLGAALRSGFAQCEGDAVLTLDADLTFSPSEVKRLLNAFDDDVACVLGSPLKGRMEGVSALRAAMSHAVNAIYRVLLGRPVTSASSIFRLYRSSALTNLTLTSRSFDINAEILLKILQKGGHVREVPATLGRRRAGVSKIRFGREIKNHLFLFARILAWRLK
jgi:glycosyltransferase involved in cell wall biosynthesis